MNVLVTGGFGYIGSRLLPELVRQGHRVGIAARHVPPHFAAAAREHAFHAWDVREPWSGQAPGRYDVLVHLAAANDVDSADAAAALQVNAWGTRNALEFCRAHAVPWFVYVSTFQVYGVWEGAVDDATVPMPSNDYGLTHWFAEEYVRMYGRGAGPRYVILRPTNIYGAPAHRSVDRWTLVPNCFCREAVESGAITLRSSGRQERDFIGLGTLASRIAAVVGRLDAHRDGVFTVSSGRSVTIRAVAELVAQRYAVRFGRRCELRVLSGEPKETRRLTVKSERAAGAGLLAPEVDAMSDEIDLTFDVLRGS